MPIETVTGQRSPSRQLEGRGRDRCRTRSARRTPSAVPVAGSRTTNSSPPKRAATSLARTSASMRCANSRSTASPAAWPQVSLTCLKRSISSMRHTSRTCSRLRAGEFFLQAHLQVTAVVPPGQNVGEARAQEPGTVHDVLDAVGGNDAEMRKEITGMPLRVAVGVVTAEVQAANQLATVLQWQDRDGREAWCRQDELVVAGQVRPEPWATQVTYWGARPPSVSTKRISASGSAGVPRPAAGAECHGPDRRAPGSPAANRSSGACLRSAHETGTACHPPATAAFHVAASGATCCCCVRLRPAAGEAHAPSIRAGGEYRR